MLKVMLDDEMRISSDGRQYMIQTRYENPKTGEITWVSQHFFGKLEHLLNFYVDMNIRKKEIKTIKELLQEVKQMRKEIGEMVGGI